MFLVRTNSWLYLCSHFIFGVNFIYFLDHPVMLAWAIDILEGKDIADAVSMLATRLGLSSPAKLVKTCTALATLIW